MNQSASRVILVRPTGFGYDPETAVSNSFQRKIDDGDVQHRAEAEFDALIHALHQCRVGVTVLDPADPTAPNAVFPNNWFSTDEEGGIWEYPMATPSRRRERIANIDEVLQRHGSRVERSLSLVSHEGAGQYLEGTGSLVLDRVARVAYAALSARTHERVVRVWCDQAHYRPVLFTATMDGTLTGQAVYHTNVLMSIGERFAAVCFDAIPYPADRDDVMEELEKSGKEIIPITLDQMHRFVGNMLQLRSSGPEAASYIFLSETAFEALRPEQRMILERHGQLVPVAVPTIEAVGGGSVRCMLAENFLPSR